MKSGVPQGSIFGPILFLIYINDLPDTVIHAILKLFADDSKVYANSKSTKNNQLQIDIFNLCEWAKRWLLKFNSEKCHCLHTPTDHYLLSLANKMIEIQHCKTEKDLWVTFDSSLKFSEHCTLVSTKVNQIVGIIR